MKEKELRESSTCSFCGVGPAGSFSGELGLKSSVLIRWR